MHYNTIQYVVSLVPSIWWKEMARHYNVNKWSKPVQFVLNTSNSLSWSITDSGSVPYCRTGNREGMLSKHSSWAWNNEVRAAGRMKTLAYWVAADWLNGFTQSDCHVPRTSNVQPCTGYNKSLVSGNQCSSFKCRTNVITRWQTIILTLRNPRAGLHFHVTFQIYTLRQ